MLYKLLSTIIYRRKVKVDQKLQGQVKIIFEIYFELLWFMGFSDMKLVNLLPILIIW